MDPERAVPCGLLVNELATNAIKHAFPHGTGRVVLGVKQVGDQIELTVADDGVGMKDRDSAKSPEKRGSDYVAIFVRQLGGAVVPSGSGDTGTIVRIRLPRLLLPSGDAERVAAFRGAERQGAQPIAHRMTRAPMRTLKADEKVTQ